MVAAGDRDDLAVVDVEVGHEGVVDAEQAGRAVDRAPSGGGPLAAAHGVLDRGIAEPARHAAVEGPDGRGVEVAHQHPARVFGLVQVGQQLAQRGAPECHGAPDGEDVGRLDVEVQHLERARELRPAAGLDPGHPRRTRRQRQRGHLAGLAQRDSHAGVIDGRLELAVGQHLGDRAGLVRRQLLDGADVHLERVELANEQTVWTLDLDTALSLDEALKKLARADEREAKVVELRLFAGLKVAEIAELLGIDIGCVKRFRDRIAM